MKNFFLRNREAALAVIVAAMALLVGLRAPVFLTGGNLLDVLNDSSILVILVMGQMVVLLTKGIDLSVASNLALTGMFCAVVGKAYPALNAVELVLIALAFSWCGLLGFGFDTVAFPAFRFKEGNRAGPCGNARRPAVRGSIRSAARL